jgi:hypothetical protein
MTATSVLHEAPAMPGLRFARGCHYATDPIASPANGLRAGKKHPKYDFLEIRPVGAVRDYWDAPARADSTSRFAVSATSAPVLFPTI